MSVVRHSSKKSKSDADSIFWMKMRLSVLALKVPFSKTNIFKRVGKKMLTLAFNCFYITVLKKFKIIP